MESTNSKLKSGMACPAKNFSLIENLWPEKHFRGPLRGPDSYFVRVPPHYLAHHANYTRCRRKVYIDVGARSFLSGGMLDMFLIYPPVALFDEFYAFESQSGFYSLPSPKALHQKLHNVMPRHRIDAFRDRHFYFQSYVRAESDPNSVPPTLGLSSLLATALRITKEDMVVAKIDVEGDEYDLVDRMDLDGTLELVDEMMIEVHYNHSTMNRMFKWCRTPQPWCSKSRHDALRLLTRLRRRGVYAHYWP